MTLNDLQKLSKIFNDTDTKHRTVFLRQLSFLSSSIKINVQLLGDTSLTSDEFVCALNSLWRSAAGIRQSQQVGWQGWTKGLASTVFYQMPCRSRRFCKWGNVNMDILFNSRRSCSHCSSCALSSFSSLLLLLLLLVGIFYLVILLSIYIYIYIYIYIRVLLRYKNRHGIVMEYWNITETNDEDCVRSFFAPATVCV